MDVWGPSNIIGLKGERYYFSILDDYSRKITIYPIFEKAEVFDVFEKHVARAERQLGRKLKAIRTDNGKEFDNLRFSSYCEGSGVKHEFTNPYTPQQNGGSERLNQTILNGIRAILLESGLEKKFWTEAMLYFSHAWNRLCHSGQIKTPIELYTGRPPSVKHLRSFGSKVFVGIPKQLRHKLDNRAKAGILVGYALRTKGYRVWVPEDGKVIETINLSFSTERQSRRGAVLEPELEMFKEPVEEETTYRPTTPELPSSDEDEPNEAKQISKDKPRKAVWIREAKPRRDKSRNDIYFHEEGSNQRLNSLNQVRKYCEEQNIEFNESDFSYRGADTTQGIVNPKTQPSTSHSQQS